jgi:hypothetical protein
LPRTLKSLAAAGFASVTVFMDDAPADCSHGRGFVPRCPRINAFNNWALALWELWCRNPKADRWAIFQDDCVASRNVREYLDQAHHPVGGYSNLYTFPSNASLCPKDHVGWYLSNQFGRGAVGLVFDRAAILALLTSDAFAVHPSEAAHPDRKIDGVVCLALSEAGIREYVHNPSLLQHTGLVSSNGNAPQLLAEGFRGEDFDARELLTCAKPPPEALSAVRSRALSRPRASPQSASKPG